MIRRAVVALALLLGLAVPARAAETPIPPAPTHWVTDEAGLLSPATRSALDARLRGYQQATGHQVIVYIGTTLGGSPLEEWAAKAFSTWGVGQKGKDDGVALFVFPTDHLLRIEVGYGLEDKLPDAYAARIVREVMAPELRAGSPDRAVEDGVDQILSRLGGEHGGTYVPPLPPAHRGPGLATIILGAVIALFLLGFAVTHPRMAIWLLWSLMSSGRGGGWGGGGGGGGFSGGGGRSGGGGASGSW
jgi:uncharacterized protein